MCEYAVPGDFLQVHWKGEVELECTLWLEKEAELIVLHQWIVVC